jgi:hypothetical protein
MSDERNVFGRSPRCWFHKQPNVLATLPKSALLAALRDIYNAEDIDKAQIAIHCFMSDRPARYRFAAAPSSTRCNLSAQHDHSVAVTFIRRGKRKHSGHCRSPAIRSTTTW